MVCKMDEMTDKSGCEGCQHSHDLRGCASHHIETARNLIAEGKIEEADENLKGIQRHLRE
jgi:hypothetical protein